MFKKIKQNKKTILACLICSLVVGIAGVSATTLLYSKDVTYDNTSSGLSSTNLQDALDELYEKAKNAPSCDSNGNCTVTCPSDKPNYEATSTGYKCTAGFRGTVYAFNTGQVTIGTSTLTNLGTSYATFAAAAASNSNSGNVIVLKYTVKDDVLIAGYVCFLEAGVEYCLKGYDTNEFANNVLILNTADPYCGASTSGNGTSCDTDDVYAYVYSNGGILVRSKSRSWACEVTNAGRAYCHSYF